MNKFLYLIIIHFCVSINAFSQSLSDDFSDGDFDNNPTWQGNTTDFIVSSNRLQLSASSAGQSYLMVDAMWSDTCSWQFDVELDFSPSGSNKLQVWLSVDKGLDNSNLTGYYLELGETGSDDTWHFYYSDNGSAVKLASASLGLLSGTNNKCNVLITRSKLGEWILSVDPNGLNNLKQEFKVIHNKQISGSYFAFNCFYTSTRVDKFFFDNIKISPLFIDVDPPIVDQVVAINANSVQVIFNEGIEQKSAETLNNYMIDGVNPIEALLVSSNTVNLKFANPFSVNQTTLISISGIADNANNILKTNSYSFVYELILKGEIIFSEIFADPSPVVALPEQEYFELYNTSNRSIQLNNIHYTDANSNKLQLPEYELKASSYVVVCPSGASNDFSITNIIELDSWPALNNSGDELSLYFNESIIDVVKYTNAWYKDVDKSSGGFSLERKNLVTKCSSYDNWAASNNSTGGTPGVQNSIWTNKADSLAPVIIDVPFISNKQIKLVFNEPIDSQKSKSLIVQLDSDIGILKSIVAPSFDSVIVEFNSGINVNTKYNLTVSDVFDCEGNKLDTVIYEIVNWKAESPSSYDLLITEIMPDPEPPYSLPSAEYIELFNASTKPINLLGYTLIDATSELELPDYIIAPNSYVLLCSSSSVDLFDKDIQVLGISGFISLNNGGELLQLTHKDEIEPIFLDYNTTWYQDDEKAKGGYSLEMLDINNPCGGIENWRAAKDGIYGTPGKVNSWQEATLDHKKISIDKVLMKSSNVLQVLLTKSARFYASNIEVSISPNDAILDSVVLSKDTLNLNFLLDLDSTRRYTISIKGLVDCQGNTMNDTLIEFKLPTAPTPFSIIINEILFNPTTGGSDFIELHNRTKDTVDISNLSIANRSDEGEIENVEKLTFKGLYLLPNAKATFTDDREWVLENYFVQNPDSLFEFDLPSMNDDEGTIVILFEDKIIDELSYTNSWHFSLLEDENGVSLERINYNSPTQLASNWQSAASSVGFATPTYTNSQASISLNNKVEIEVFPQTFSPNNDGIDDFTQISISNEFADASASIVIYNLAGQEQKQIESNALLGKANVFKWDGTNDNGEKSKVGVYIIKIEILSLDGTVNVFKKGVVIAGDF